RRVCTLLLLVPGSSPGRCQCALSAHQGPQFHHMFLTWEVSPELLGPVLLGSLW
ncbi:hypothetical protein A2U01_0107460, partial [Trifolium medium]|nr:hypothetical protein [Trifolium medium]